MREVRETRDEGDERQMGMEMEMRGRWRWRWRCEAKMLRDARSREGFHVRRDSKSNSQLLLMLRRELYFFSGTHSQKLGSRLVKE